MNTPTQWSENYFRLLLDYEYELVKLAGRRAAVAADQPEAEEDMAPAAHDPSKRVPTMMTTADMALQMDPEFRKISEKFRNDHEAFKDAFARAWFKLTHRDMGPEGPLPRPGSPGGGPDLAGSGPGRHHAVRRATSRRSRRRSSMPASPSASWSRPPGRRPRPIRKSDHRGGANGARIRLAPQKDWAVNEPDELAKVLAKIDELRGGLSMADAIVLAGTAAVEKAARDAGFNVDGPVHRRPRRRDAGMDRRRKLRR